MSEPFEDPENCALRKDGTLKEASEITWTHSPTSSASRALPPSTPPLETSDPEESDSDGKKMDGLKGKQPARRVQRVRVPSLKVREQASTFFTKRIVGT